MPDIVSKPLCAPASEVAVLFNSNLSRRPFLRQVVNVDLLLCTGFDLEHENFFLCHISTKGPMYVERLSETIDEDLVGNNFSPIPSKI